MVSRQFPTAAVALFVSATLLTTALGAPAPAFAADSTVTRVWTENARYTPGEQAVVNAQISGGTSARFRLVHLGAEVQRSGELLADSSGRVQWTVTLPHQDYRGYTVEVDSGQATGETAIDVSSDNSRFTRFGFLDSYGESLTSAEQRQVVDELVQDYHINAFQFSDWMWRHEAPIRRDAQGGVATQWAAWNGDVIASSTVRGLVDAVHARNAQAFPYSMSYAALHGFESNGVDADWALKYRQDDGNGPIWKFEMLTRREDSTLWIMNPQNEHWRKHVVGQYVDQINTMGFDGTHIDQLGNWGGAPDGGMDDLRNQAVDIPKGFSDLIDETVNATGRFVGMNAVDGFGADRMASGQSDYLYTEMWADHERYSDIQSYLQSQRELSGNKPAVVAAYMNNKSNFGSAYEAEDSSVLRSGVRVSTDHARYSGTGFIDYFGEVGDSVTFTVHVDQSRNYGLVPRWSNATGEMAQRTFWVDGRKVGTVLLGTTASWDEWNIEGGTHAYLSAGDHTVTISVEEGDYGHINLDNLTTNSFSTPSVQLFDAALAANGASHIEMGQGNRMLVAAYFPDKTKWMDPELSQWMKNYYNVTTGYENLLYGPTLRPLEDRKIDIMGYPVSRDGQKETIWANVMRSEGMDIIHLINLLDNDELWRDIGRPIRTQKNLTVRYHYGSSATPSQVYMVTPDNDGGRAQKLVSRLGEDAEGKYVEIEVPSLHAWDMIFMGESTQGNGNVVNQAAKCLDARHGQSANGTAVQLYDCASVDAQRVAFEDSKLKVMGKCLDVAQQSKENGAAVHLWDCASIPSQTWYHTRMNEYYHPYSGKCLSIEGDSYSNGTSLQLWECHRGKSQKWSLPQ